MKLYADYIKEREELEMEYDDHCFLTYKIEDNEVTVYDIFSDKEVRNTGYMLKFCDNFYGKMAEKGIKIAYGMTDTRTNGWKNSERLLIKYGFKFIGLNPENEYVKHYCYEIAKTGEL